MASRRGGFLFCFLKKKKRQGLRPPRKSRRLLQGERRERKRKRELLISIKKSKGGEKEGGGIHAIKAEGGSCLPIVEREKGKERNFVHLNSEETTDAKALGGNSTLRSTGRKGLKARASVSKKKRGGGRSPSHLTSRGLTRGKKSCLFL